MSWIFTGLVAVAFAAAVLTGRGSELAAAVPQGAQAGITLALSMAGAFCLWSGVGNLMDKTGVTQMLALFLQPLLNLIFPTSKKDAGLRRSLSGNICANILGLGNAATPMGIKAVKGLRRPDAPGVATDEMCRLIVLNTASIQLIPANVAAVRASLGCASPFDILPAVWLTSLCSATLGLSAAAIFGKLWCHD